MLEADAQCQELVHRQFQDLELGLCSIAHWDTDCGVRRIFYRPVNDPEDLHHGEPSVVRAWVARDNIAQLHPTGTQLFWGKVNGLLGLPTLEIPIAVEATVVCLVSKIQASTIPADVSIGGQSLICPSRLLDAS